MRVVFPHVKSSIALVLIITAFWITGYQAYTRDFYTHALISSRDQLKEQGMTVVPELINRMLTVTGRREVGKGGSEVRF